MPRILLLITDLKIGGTPTVVRELAIRLNRVAGPADRVHVACLAPWGPVADQLHAAGIGVTALHAQGPGDLRVIGRLARLIQQEQFDTIFSFLIHANAAAAAASIFCRNVRCIQSIQTTQPEPRWHWKVQRLAHRAADKVVVPSESVATVASHWSHVPREKIVVIPNAVDAEAFCDLPAPPPEARPLPVGFIGRLDPIKRIPDLLEATRRLNGLVHLHLFGEGSERAALERQIVESNLQVHVTLHGAIAQPQDALSQVGLLVLPSEAEGFGLVLIEAMAAGVPVVATNVLGIRDVVRDGITGLLVPPGQPEALAHAIRRIIDDPILRQLLTHNAKDEVSRRFGWESTLDKYRHILRI